jgi:DNA-binding NarL/FixJ family response regulator
MVGRVLRIAQLETGNRANFRTSELTMISVLVSDSNSLGCHLLADALGRVQPRMNVVGTATRHDELVEKTTGLRPSVVLLSSGLQDGPLSGFRALVQLRGAAPAAKKIMLLESSEPELLVAAFRGGASGVFFRMDSISQLAKCIESVSEGQIWASQAELRLVCEALANCAPLAIAPTPRTCLSNRDRQLLQLLSAGLSPRQISRKMATPESTAARYIAQLCEKLGVRSKVELAMYGMEILQKPASSNAAGSPAGLGKTA